MKMEPMDYGFKFQIGQLLKTIAGVPGRDRFLSPRTVKYAVVERLLQECPGGVQRSYACRAVFEDGGVSEPYIRFNEIELEATTTFAEDAKAQEEEEALREAARKPR